MCVLDSFAFNQHRCIKNVKDSFKGPVLHVRRSVGHVVCIV